MRPEDASGFPLTRTIEFMLERDPGHAPLHPSQSWMDRINTAQMEVGRNRWQAVTALANFDLDDGLAPAGAADAAAAGGAFLLCEACR